MPRVRDGQSGSNGSVIKPIDTLSAHKITSGQVVIDLQTALKELVENSLDAGSTNIEVRLKNYGVDSIEVIDNGTGISPADYDAVALKHHTSKLSSFDDLSSVGTFGFRGEALSSLCALTESLTVTTATASEAPMGTILKFDKQGRLSDKSGRVARQHGTTVVVTGLFKPLPVRRKELERNAKREFGKALHLLNAYAIVPCASENGGVRLTCSNQAPGGKKSEQLRTDGSLSTRASISALWGPKTLDHLDDLDLRFEVETEKSLLRRLGNMGDADKQTSNEVRVRGVTSKFALNCGRSTTDRQFFYINGRPCQPSKVQKAFNEVYRTFNATQSPLIVADFILPKNSLDINVSPDKRTIFIHSEDNLVQALKAALEEQFAPARSTYDVRFDVSHTQSHLHAKKGPNEQVPLSPPSETQEAPRATGARPSKKGKGKDKPVPLFLESTDDEDIDELATPEDSTRSLSTIAKTNDDDTMGFGRPVLLMKSFDDPAAAHLDRTISTPESMVVETSDKAILPHSDETYPVDAQANKSATESMDVDFPNDLDVAQHTPQTVSRSLALQNPSKSSESRHDAAAEGSRQAPHATSSTAGVSIPDSTSLAEETIHQIPPPRFLARSYTSSSASSASSSARATTTRTLAALRSPPGPSKDRPQADTSAKRSAGQMVLSTSGAAWNLQREIEEEDEDGTETRRPRKKPKVVESGKQAFKAMLAGYARPGSQIQATRASSEEEIEQDDEEEEVLPQDIENDPQDEATEDVREVYSPHPGRIANLVKDCSMTRTPSSGASMADVIDLTEAISEDVDMTSNVLEDEGSEDGADKPEIVKSAHRDLVTMRCDMTEMKAYWTRLRANRPSISDPDESRTGQDTDLTREAGLCNADDATRADDALSRIIEKADFATMEVVGQFNLGFIIVRRRIHKDSPAENALGGVDDLFIVDQHAADEKYNFETLQQTTKIESQKLFRPRVLEFSAPDELIALDNIDILRQNGFDIAVAAESTSETRSHRLKLVAQPVSKSTTFELRDLEELIHLLQDHPKGQMVRCSKARSMFAMRACRMSIMVGMPLTVKQMTSVIRHMGTMDQPWNCPHGRPTMRHLSDISVAGRKKKDIHWRSLLDTSDGVEN